MSVDANQGFLSHEGRNERTNERARGSGRGGLHLLREEGARVVWWGGGLDEHEHGGYYGWVVAGNGLVRRLFDLMRK